MVEKRLASIRLWVTAFRKLGPTGDEREKALTLWIKYVQSYSFKEILASLRGLSASPPSVIQQLTLFLDEMEVIRGGTRFAHSDLGPSFQKFPIYLPSTVEKGKVHPFTRLLIMDLHRANAHASIETTLGLFRRSYWTANGRWTVKAALRGCFECRVTKGRTLPLPVHGQLPAERTKSGSPAFSSVICDQLGPILVISSDRRSMEKRWVLVFSCCASRGIHLEWLASYSAQAVLCACERMWGRRGVTSGTLFLDRATAFVGTANALSALSPPFKFTFSAVRAPWSHGAVERMVGLTKDSLRPLLWHKKVNDEELITILAKIESTLNLRPLYPCSSSPDDFAPITPAMLLYNSSLLELPSTGKEIVYSNSQTVRELLAAKHRRDVIAEEWWTRWSREYLSHLRNRHFQERKGRQSQLASPLIGHLYLLAEPTPRGQWKLVRVIQLFPDKFGQVRRVLIKSSTGHVSERPVSSLVPLELEEAEESSAVEESESEVVTQASPTLSNEEPAPSDRQLRFLRRQLLKSKEDSS